MNKENKNKIDNSNDKFLQNLNILYRVNKAFQKDVDDLRHLILPEEYWNYLFDFNYEPEETPETDEELLEREQEDSLADYMYYVEVGNEPLKDKDIEIYWSAKRSVKKEKKHTKLISELRIKYNLSQSYHDYLEDFINNPDSTFEYSRKFLPDSLIPIKINNPDNPKEVLSVLNITPDTSIADVKKFWKQIKIFASLDTGKNSKPKLYPSAQLIRDLFIYKLHDDHGKTAKEIQKYINSDKQTLSCEEINIIIKRLKDKAKRITQQDKESIV